MDNLIGKTLDGLYTIRELIGAGGMANVYKAVVSAPGGPVPEGTVVAVKVLRQELMHDADLVRRFKNESKAISLLNGGRCCQNERYQGTDEPGGTAAAYRRMRRAAPSASYSRQ